MSTKIIITLLTDFGLRDHYVAVMKGVILTINPQVSLVDISHQVSPHQILEGALTLRHAYAFFPPGTIHLAVVDPGVGSTRKPILVVGPDCFFVGPDNGIFGLVYPELQEFRVFELSNARYFLHPVSATFHGRDLFAPVAAHLSCGLSPNELGHEIADYTRLHLPEPQIEVGGIKGEILFRDVFGNAVTNVPRGLLENIRTRGRIKVKIGERVIPRLSHSYAEVEKGRVIALIGSSDYLEIACREGNAWESLGLRPGQTVWVERADDLETGHDVRE